MEKDQARYHHRSLYALFLIAALLFIGCGSQQRIIGKWRRLSGEICGAIYPATVEFFDDGEYVGGLPNWIGGSYRVVEGRRIKLDTSMGPGIYEFKILDNVIIFKNDWGCTFKYQKE